MKERFYFIFIFYQDATNKDVEDGEVQKSRDTVFYVSFEYVEKSMTSVNGYYTYSILTWIKEFEGTALLIN